MVEDSIILKLQLDDNASAHLDRVNSNFDKMSQKIQSIDKNLKALGIAVVFKNALDIVEKGNQALTRYEKGVLEVRKKEEELARQRRELVELQDRLNEAHDPKVLERYQELQRQIQITEEELSIKKKELNNDMINLIQSYIQLGGSTLPLLIANLGRLSSALSVVRTGLITTFITNPVGLALMGITGAVLALNEALGFLPFKFSDAFKPVDALSSVRLDALSMEVKDVTAAVEDLGKTVEDTEARFNRLKEGFMDITGVGGLGKEFERLVGKDIGKRLLISKPEVLIGELFKTDEFMRVLAMHKAGLIPERTIVANVMELLRAKGLPSQLADDARLKVEIMLRERINSLTEEQNVALTEQANMYSRLRDEVIGANTALSKFMNTIASLRRELEREVERARSMPQPLSIAAPSIGSASASNKIESHPSKPKTSMSINTAGSRSSLGQFTGGMYAY
ncbi:MAG: hypothetical protein RMJ59_02190 [Candidatus Nitrosocaldus sp.]|nr:hypothetical protein [Candidatus Nitrosocaldus sp.]MDW8275177.1 hypothetical protein [Candidatus Nitrosocaldus sp.]